MGKQGSFGVGFARLEFQTEKKTLKVGLYFSGQKV